MEVDNEGKNGGGISVITLNNKNKKAILTINLVIINIKMYTIKPINSLSLMVVDKSFS